MHRLQQLNWLRLVDSCVAVKSCRIFMSLQLVELCVHLCMLNTHKQCNACKVIIAKKRPLFQSLS
jgi:hypothetical protein